MRQVIQSIISWFVMVSLLWCHCPLMTLDKINLKEITFYVYIVKMEDIKFGSQPTHYTNSNRTFCSEVLWLLRRFNNYIIHISNWLKMLCFHVGLQEYLVFSSKYKSFSRQYSLTWAKTLRFNWTIKLVLSSFICGSLIRHRNMSFSQFEMLKDFSLPSLSHFGSRFKLSSFFPPRGIVTPHLLVAANWQATRWFPLTKSHSNVCRKEAHLEGWSRLLHSSRPGFMTLFISWVEYSVHLRCLCLNWHM
jgi:hypothetical protein